jgi:hypothetical protein
MEDEKRNEKKYKIRRSSIKEKWENCKGKKEMKRKIETRKLYQNSKICFFISSGI